MLNEETALSQRIRLALNIPLFRNLVGKFKTVDGQWVNAGLGRGSSDLIGWTSVTVTPNMVGKKVAVFTAVEVKVPGARTAPRRLADQRQFVEAVLQDGGYAGFADTIEKAKAIIHD